jgi:diacylglycerol kinase (ATP)
METNPQAPKKILFIINPASGTSGKDRIEAVIRDRACQQGVSCNIVYTSEPGHATILSREAAAGGTDVVVAVGGDGTVNETARGIIGTECILGIIPTGSGNGLARHLKIPRNTSKALDIILAGNVIKIDTATLGDQEFLSMAGVGYDAHVARKFAKSGRRGFISYFRIVSKEYAKYKPRKYTLVIDGKKITRKAFMISFANSNQFGNNASVAPRASLEDGLIDVCIVRKIPMVRLPFIIPLLFVKKFDKTVYIEIIQAREVHVKRKKGKAIHLDGEPHQIGSEFDIRIHPSSLNIIVP